MSTHNFRGSGSARALSSPSSCTASSSSLPAPWRGACSAPGAAGPGQLCGTYRGPKLPRTPAQEGQEGRLRQKGDFEGKEQEKKASGPNTAG